MRWDRIYNKNEVIIFLEQQQKSGLISPSAPNNEYHNPKHVKPVLAPIARESRLSTEYEQRANALAKCICQTLWDEENGFFYDGNARVGQ